MWPVAAGGRPRTGRRPGEESRKSRKSIFKWTQIGQFVSRIEREGESRYWVVLMMAANISFNIFVSGCIVFLALFTRCSSVTHPSIAVHFTFRFVVVALWLNSCFFFFLHVLLFSPNSSIFHFIYILGLFLCCNDHSRHKPGTAFFPSFLLFFFSSFLFLFFLLSLLLVLVLVLLFFLLLWCVPARC